MAQRIGPFVAERRRIRRATAADRIHHNKKSPHHDTRFNTKGGSSGSDVPIR